MSDKGNTGTQGDHTSPKPHMFSPDLLLLAGQCSSCGRLVLCGGKLSDVLEDTYGLNRDLDASILLRGVGVHLRSLGLAQCGSCYRRQCADHYRKQGQPLYGERSDEDAACAEVLYKSPAYRRVEAEYRERLTEQENEVTTGERPRVD